MENEMFESSYVSELEVYENVDKAFDNSYEIIMGLKSFEDIMEEQDECYFIFDVDDYSKISILEQLLEWYESEEEYEKCSLLLEKINDEKNIRKN